MTSAGNESGASAPIAVTLSDDHAFAVGDHYEVDNVTYICADITTVDAGCADVDPTVAGVVDAPDAPWSMKLVLDTTNIS
jgi:hypothetical protein